MPFKFVPKDGTIKTNQKVNHIHTLAVPAAGSRAVSSGF